VLLRGEPSGINRSKIRPVVATPIDVVPTPEIIPKSPE